MKTILNILAATILSPIPMVLVAGVCLAVGLPEAFANIAGGLVGLASWATIVGAK
jgi:hypothetical protein